MSRAFEGLRALLASPASSLAAAAAAKFSVIAAKDRVTAVSSDLGRFLGVTEASRTEALKRIWTYIKSQNLENPNNKNEIFCDEKLKTIFEGKEKIYKDDIVKMLSCHFKKTS